MSGVRELGSGAAALTLTERWNASSPVPLDSLHGLVYCAHNSPLGSTPCPQRRLRFRAHDGAGNHGQGRSLGAFFLAVHARNLGSSLVKAAILIDGAFLLKRLPRVRSDVDVDDPKPVAKAINDLVLGHLNRINRVYNVTNCIQLLYRSFYYDAWPYENKEHKPISGKAIDYARSETANFRKELFDLLRARPNFAVRLGHLQRSRDRFWTLKPGPQKSLLNGSRQVASLRDEDFVPGLEQKGVDMRIGLDIATITLKRQADIIVLVTGDSDFVPAAKLARREGVQFILDPLWQPVRPDLSEHIDGLRSVFDRRFRKDDG